ncbi:hypothetical protein B0H19DRAFT_1254168 [Mycena capillaripes]|nr:hypothetical protein B0H19DRAFT_1254168 [Mycena capillaripes]
MSEGFAIAGRAPKRNANYSGAICGGEETGAAKRPHGRAPRVEARRHTPAKISQAAGLRYILTKAPKRDKDDSTHEVISPRLEGDVGRANDPATMCQGSMGRKARNIRADARRERTYRRASARARREEHRHVAQLLNSASLTARPRNVPILCVSTTPAVHFIWPGPNRRRPSASLELESSFEENKAFILQQLDILPPPGGDSDEEEPQDLFGLSSAPVATRRRLAPPSPPPSSPSWDPLSTSSLMSSRYSLQLDFNARLHQNSGRRVLQFLPRRTSSTRGNETAMGISRESTNLQGRRFQLISQ